jgi:hypothetical protein
MLSKSLLKTVLIRNFLINYQTNNNNNNNKLKSYDIFLSYHWRDQVEVIKLHRELVKYFNVWLDLVEIKIGDDLNECINNAIQNSNLFICCLNSEYLNTFNCKYELIKAQREDKKIYILPFEASISVNSKNYLMSEYEIKCDNIYELKNKISIDKDISTILEFILGTDNAENYVIKFLNLNNFSNYSSSFLSLYRRKIVLKEFIIQCLQ